MEHRDLVPEPRHEAVHELNREPDLGNQNEDLTALLEGALGRPHIDLGLATGRHPAQQHDPEIPGAKPLLDVSQGTLLFRGEHGAGRRRRGLLAAGVRPCFARAGVVSGGLQRFPFRLAATALDRRHRLRQRGTQHLPPRCRIVIGDPACEIEELGGERGLCVEHGAERQEARPSWAAGGWGHDDPGQDPPPERNFHARPGHGARGEIAGDRVDEGAIDADRHRDRHEGRSGRRRFGGWGRPAVLAHALIRSTRPLWLHRAGKQVRARFGKKQARTPRETGGAEERRHPGGRTRPPRPGGGSAGREWS